MSVPPSQPVLPLNALPPRLDAGDTLAFALQTALPPLSGTVTFILTAVVANVPTGITLGPVTVDADSVATFTTPRATTAAWAPAKYAWVCLGLEPLADLRSTLAKGEIRILPDPASPTPVDPRTENEIILANIRLLLKGKSTTDVQMYKIGTREVTGMSRMDLLKVEAIYESRVRRERIARGEKVPRRTVGIRFGGAG